MEIWLSTHDAGDIVTEKDKKLAKKIDAHIKTILASEPFDTAYCFHHINDSSGCFWIQ